MEEIKTYKETRFQFSLLFNGNLVVKRFFEVNHFNPKSLNSVEFTNTLFDINGIQEGRMGLIPSFLKKKSEDACWKFFNPYVKQDPNSVNTININDRDFNYDLIVSVDGRNVGSVRFNGNIFQSDVTDYTNITPIIKEIIYSLRKVMSTPNNRLTYHGDDKNQIRVSELVGLEYINA